MRSWHRSIGILSFALGVGAPYCARAQPAHRWSVDAAVGGANVDSHQFFNNGRAVAHLSVADRVVQRGRFAAYVEAGYDWFGQFGLLGSNPDLVCLVDASGSGCRPAFPEITGPSASIGLVYLPVSRVQIRAGAGGAAYSVDGTRVGAALGRLDGAVFPTANVGVILSGGLAVMPRYRHDRLTMIPISLGLRVR